MSNIVTSNYTLTEDQIKTLVQAGVIPDKTPTPQIAVFGQICKERGLSAFSKEIYLVGYGNKYSVIVGINGFRKIASETGELAGIDDPIFDLQPGGAYKTAAALKAEGKRPTTATVTVYRIVRGIKCAFSHTAVFSEFCGSGKWEAMPFQMIGKVAEAFALRKGFSDRLTGLSDESEAAAIMEDTAVARNIHDAARQKAIESVREKMERADLDQRQIDATNAMLDDQNTQIEKIWAINGKLVDRLTAMQDAADPAKQFKKMNF